MIQESREYKQSRGDLGALTDKNMRTYVWLLTNDDSGCLDIKVYV